MEARRAARATSPERLAEVSRLVERQGGLKMAMQGLDAMSGYVNELVGAPS